MCDIMGGGRRVLTGLGRVPAYTLATTGSPTQALSPGSHLLASATVRRTNRTSYDLIDVSKVRRTT